MRSRSSGTRRPNSAFTLLELLIVVGVMVGVMAMVWPSLRKPLSQSALQQAASVVREAFDESRQSAAVNGTPVLVAFEQGSVSFRSAPLDYWLNDRLETYGRSQSARSVRRDSEKDSSTTSPITPHLWQFPADIRIERVVKGKRLAKSADSFADMFAQRRAEDEAAIEKLDEDRTQKIEWFVTFLPNGQTDDISIELRDVVSERRITINLLSGTGQVEIQKPVMAPTNEGGDSSAPRAENQAPTSRGGTHDQP